MTQGIRFLLNGDMVTLETVDPTGTLLDFLRLRRRLTGTKEGCAEGDCGACTVLIGRLAGDDLLYESVNACIRFTGSLNATHVVTVEHLAQENGRLHPVQQAMVDCHGSQCGFCTPGIVMSLYGLWLSNDDPTRSEIERALQGNLCRCTGYEPIVRAAEQASTTRPSALFDPIRQERERVTARLKEFSTAETIRIGGDGRELVVPGSAAALAEVLAEQPDAVIVAGATDVGLWVTKQMRELSPVVFINHLTELQQIEADAAGITLGAGVSYSAAWAALAREIPALARLIDRIGGQQVRHMGTIGGNIANGSPIGDMPPALIALGATVTLRSAGGRRTLPLEDFFIAYGRQDRKQGEFVERIFVPRPADGSHYAVYKVSKRREEDITATLGAYRLQLGADGTVDDIRIAYGGMAGIPKRASAVEVALAGKPWTAETIESAREAFDRDFQPLTDWRASAEYRQLTAKNLLTRFFLETTGQGQELQRFAVEEA
ncbi:xanthine dehydrogenase small subunit [Rhizobium halophytocola]|uniref:Xanthine dehydrogenase small subunit n=1 Tax=Rhizobium halophytocola TaxID=735519 RepID=A0ABS4E619_9HYPH|nr:xanthine dehydrogenase small subunit [Rhizobium halophytocola]MBP1853396.1 xanthine dehydrogenase small subunit [Rhizobium halophytocola]